MPLKPTIDPAKLPVVRLGSRGDAVVAAKMGINAWRKTQHKGPVNESKWFGPYFGPYVWQFQRAKGVRGSGVIGPKTWEKLLPYLNEEARRLLVADVVGVPVLGPIVAGGQSVLEHDCTHATDGIQLYPAFDDAFGAGRAVIAPEAITVTNPSHSNPGQAFYATGDSKVRYWFGHLDRTHNLGERFKKGEVVGFTIPTPPGFKWGGPHCHVGVNVELLWGAGTELIHHTNYTHGAPTIGAQLAAHGAA